MGMKIEHVEKGFFRAGHIGPLTFSDINVAVAAE